MVEKALEGLNLEEFNQKIFTIIKDHADKYQADKILQDVFSSHFQINANCAY